MKARRIISGTCSTRFRVPFHPFHQAVKDGGRNFLLYLLSHAAKGVLSHEQEYGDVIGIAPGYTGQGVGGSGAGARHGHSHFARGARIAVSNLDSQPFMPGCKCADRLSRNIPDGTHHLDARTILG